MPTIFIIGLLCAALILMAAALWRQRLSSLRMNRDLMASEKQFRLFAEVSPDALLINRNGISVYANPAALLLLGMTGQEQIIGKTPFDYIHPNDRAAVKELFVSTLQGRSLPLKEVRMIPRNRGSIVAEIIATGCDGPDGLATLMVLRDITMRKQAEEAAQEMNTALALAMPGIARVNHFGQYFAMNDTYAGLLGYEPSSLIGKDWSCMVQPDSLPIAQAAFETMMREGRGEFEAVAVREDGSTFSNQVILMKDSDQQGGVPGHRCFMRDVTECKRLDERVQRTETLLREVIDTDPNFIFIKDREGRFTLVNKTVAEAYGTTVEGLLGKTDADFNADAGEREQFRQADLMVMDSLQECVIPEERITDARGRLRWLQTVKRPFMIWNGRADFVLGVATDITDRKQSDAARLVSEERFKALVSGVKDFAIVMLDHAGRVTTWNLGAMQIIGYEEQEIVGQSMEAFFTKEDREAGHPAWLMTQAAAKGAVSEEGWRVRKNETQYWGSDVVTAMHGAAGQVIGFAMITRNLTERKISEDMIAQSEQRFRALIETAGSAIVNVSLQGRIMSWNRAAEHISGWKRTEVVGKLFSDLCAMEQRRDMVLIDMQKALAGEPVQGTEYQFLACDGRERSCSWNLNRLTNEQGTPIGLIAVGEDITVRRQTDMALVEEKQQLEAIIRSLPGVFYVFDIEGRFLRWNQALERESGYGKDEIHTMHPEDFFAPEDRASVRAKIQEAFIAGSITLEVELLRKDGTSCPYYLAGHAVCLEGNAHIIGVGIDISERKHAEAQLQKVNEQLLVMSTNLEQVREQEQRRIARDLHDELGHQLTTMKMDAFLLARRAQASMISDPQVAIEVVQRLLHQIDAAISSVQKIARQVRPNLLDRVGLVPALEASVSDFKERTGIKATFTFDSALEALEQDDALNTAFYRVVQEALTNVARHSGATAVEVRLRKEAGGLVLDIEDNGKGFDPQQYAPDRSLGVRGMQERVAIVKGQFSIVGRKGQGSTVTVRIKKGVEIPC